MSSSSSSSSSASSAELSTSIKKRGGLWQKKEIKNTNQETPSEDTSGDVVDIPSGMGVSDGNSELPPNPTIRKSGGFSLCDFLGKPRWFVIEFQYLQRDLLIFFRKMKDLSLDEAKAEFPYMDPSFLDKCKEVWPNSSDEVKVSYRGIAHSLGVFSKMGSEGLIYLPSSDFTDGMIDLDENEKNLLEKVNWPVSLSNEYHVNSAEISHYASELMLSLLKVEVLLFKFEKGFEVGSKIYDRLIKPLPSMPQKENIPIKLARAMFARRLFIEALGLLERVSLLEKDFLIIHSSKEYQAPLRQDFLITMSKAVDVSDFLYEKIFVDKASLHAFVRLATMATTLDLLNHMDFLEENLVATFVQLDDAEFDEKAKPGVVNPLLEGYNFSTVLREEKRGGGSSSGMTTHGGRLSAGNSSAGNKFIGGNVPAVNLLSGGISSAGNNSFGGSLPAVSLSSGGNLLSGGDFFPAVNILSSGSYPTEFSSRMLGGGAGPSASTRAEATSSAPVGYTNSSRKITVIPYTIHSPKVEFDKTVSSFKSNIQMLTKGVDSSIYCWLDKESRQEVDYFVRLKNEAFPLQYPSNCLGDISNDDSFVNWGLNRLLPVISEALFHETYVQSKDDVLRTHHSMLETMLHLTKDATKFGSCLQSSQHWSVFSEEIIKALSYRDQLKTSLIEFDASTLADHDLAVKHVLKLLGERSIRPNSSGGITAVLLKQ